MDMLSTRMKTSLVIITITLSVAALAAQAATPEPATPEPTFRDRIRAARAKEAEETKSGPSARPWDRNGDGKRPWETPAKPSDTSKP